VTRVAAVGLLTGWGEGVTALPEDAAAAARGREVIALGRPEPRGDRFRRATRECLLGVAAVEAMLKDAGLARRDIAGPGTGLVYVTAAAYGASNVSFLAAGGGGTLHFPYTAPSAVPAEVAIEFSLRGPYVILIGGAPTTLDALAQADGLLARGVCARVIVLAVETFAECSDLYARARWLLRRPLVEAAASVLVLPEGARAVRGGATAPSPLEVLAVRRAGETLACAPLIALALARAAEDERPLLSGQWRGRRASLACAVARRPPLHAAGS
jgi:hypothetical protein